MYGVLISSRRR